MKEQFKITQIPTMMVVLALMELEGISPLESDKINEADAPVVSTSNVAVHRLSSKAQRSRRRKISVCKDRHNRRTEAENKARRLAWIGDNFCKTGGSVPIKHRKFASIAESMLAESLFYED